ncbi:hypothetical protein ZOSMA_48G00320 [Zostera marina]|uniref:Sialate O-acetylesterase domain-containing protein n=1 Tax=Zostera marina TaxID=29655 RepID=A0A0K9P1M5_ZOSMR|nr:hypothetical protein ZOSMA_48G00320 [Zostera marina]
MIPKSSKFLLTLVFSICFYFLLQIRATTTNCSSGVMETTQTTHIFILSGQSNMAGRGGVYNGEWNKLVPPECQPNPRILRFSAESEWVEANVPLHADIDVTKVCGIGPGMIFANNYLPVCAAKTVVGLVPCAIGGTAIAEWEKGEYKMV